MSLYSLLLIFFHAANLIQAEYTKSDESPSVTVWNSSHLHISWKKAFRNCKDGLVERAYVKGSLDFGMALVNFSHGSKTRKISPCSRSPNWRYYLLIADWSNKKHRDLECCRHCRIHRLEALSLRHNKNWSLLISGVVLTALMVLLVCGWIKLKKSRSYRGPAKVDINGDYGTYDVTQQCTEYSTVEDTNDYYGN